MTAARVQIVQVPYDSGHYRERAGRGPDRFRAAGLADVLRADGHEVGLARLTAGNEYPTEIGTTFELNRLLAAHLRALPAGIFPLILAGNCNSCIGAIAGLGAEGLGLIWFDAHGDFNTPETTVTGYLDGMGLAMAAGICWRSLLETVPGFTPVGARNIVHVGARDLDAGEERLLLEAGLTMVRTGAGMLDALAEAVAALARTAGKVHLHLDLDVLDGGLKANSLAAPGGPGVETVLECIRLIKRSSVIGSCTIASYDPVFDRDGAVARAGIALIRTILAQA